MFTQYQNCGRVINAEVRAYPRFTQGGGLIFNNIKNRPDFPSFCRGTEDYSLQNCALLTS